MRKTVLGLLAAFIAVVGTASSLTPWDPWAMPIFRPYARSSRLRRWLFDDLRQRPPIRH